MARSKKNPAQDDAAFAARVAELEAEGLTTSDAQSAADAEQIAPKPRPKTGAQKATEQLARDAAAVAAVKADSPLACPFDKGPLEPTIKVTKVARQLVLDSKVGSYAFGTGKRAAEQDRRVVDAFTSLPANGGPVNLSRADAEALRGYIATLTPAAGSVEEEARELLVIRIKQALVGERQMSVGEYLMAHPRKAAAPAPKAAKGAKPRAATKRATKGATKASSGKTVKVAVAGGEVEVSPELAAAIEANDQDRIAALEAVAE